MIPRCLWQYPSCMNGELLLGVLMSADRCSRSSAGRELVYWRQILRCGHSGSDLCILCINAVRIAKSLCQFLNRFLAATHLLGKAWLINALLHMFSMASSGATFVHYYMFGMSVSMAAAKQPAIRCATSFAVAWDFVGHH